MTAPAVMPDPAQPFGIPWHDDAAKRIRESGIDEHFMLQFLLGYLAHSEEFRTAVDYVLGAFGPALAPLPEARS